MAARVWDAATVPLAWEGDMPSIADIEERIRADLGRELKDLEHPSDLLFHTILLENDFEGPTVTAFGQDGSESIHLRYSSSKTERV